MMQKLIACSLLLFSFSLLHADDPEDLNCDFESGMDKWRGDGRLESDETGNKVCTLKKTGERLREITHKIDLPKGEAFDIFYRVRAMPGSEDVRIRRAIRNATGAGFSDKRVTADGKWVNHRFSAKGKGEERVSERIICIIFREGEGVIQIDDIKVVPK